MSLKSSASINVGDELKPRVKNIAQRQIDAYSGVRPKSIHTDAEWAKQKGFDAPLAQDPQQLQPAEVVDLPRLGLRRDGDDVALPSTRALTTPTT